MRTETPQILRVHKTDFSVIDQHISRLAEFSFENGHIITRELQTDSNMAADGAVIHGSGRRRFGRYGKLSGTRNRRSGQRACRQKQFVFRSQRIDSRL